MGGDAGGGRHGRNVDGRISRGLAAAGTWQHAEVREPEEEPGTSPCFRCVEGFPRATVLVVSSGLIGLEVASMFLLTSMTLSVTAEFQLRHVQQGLLMSFASLGGLCGAFVVGHISDRKGRRPPVLWSLASLALFGFSASLAESYTALVSLGVGIGLSLGGGVVPVSVLLSETTRQDQRMVVRGVCQTLGGILGFVMLVAIHLDDPTLRHLHWRSLLRGLAFSSAVLCAVAFFCVPESPTFLQANARCAIDASRSWNLAIMRGDLSTTSAFQEETTIRSQLDIVFSRRFYFTTIYLSFAGFLFGLVQGGHQYALPQILSKESSLLTAAMGRIAISCCGVPMAPVAQYTAATLTRRKALVALGLSSILVAASAAALGSWPGPQAAALEILFFVGMSFDPYRAFLGGLLFGEIGADVYPTTTAGFGASIIAMSVGVATIVAPLLFEGLKLMTGQWTTFYFGLLILLVQFVAATLALEPRVEPYRPQEELGLAAAFAKAKKAQRSASGAAAENDSSQEAKLLAEWDSSQVILTSRNYGTIFSPEDP